MPSLGGVTIYPSNIEPELIPNGEKLESANKVVTHVLRGDGNKWRWVLSWERVPASVRNQVRTLALQTGTMTFVDEDGASYTVIRDFDGPFRSAVGDIEQDGSNLYNITVVIEEEA